MAQNNLAICYDRGDGVRKSYKKAIEWYTKSAEQGNVKAQYNLAECYEIGSGVKKDIDKAVEWYTKAAAQGDEEAKNKLSLLQQKKK